MGQCKCSVPSVEEAESAQQFRALDANKNNLACREEMSQYVASRAELWAMLSVNLNVSEDVSRATATRVAMELASGLEGEAAVRAEITEAQFHAFRARYMLNGKGAQEFFHRCVFASFDTDGNHSLDTEELDDFLDTFYKAGSIFEGDSRLPPKEELKQRILNNSSNAKGGKLTFEEIRNVLRGNTTAKSFPSSASTSEPSSRSDNSNTHGNKAPSSLAAPEAAPEETPEPMSSAALTPPSLEFGSSAPVVVAPEQTPEVQPFEAINSSSAHSSSGKQQRNKPRQRKSTKEGRAKSRSRSPSARARRNQSRSRSPSQTKARTRSKSKSRSPSAKAPPSIDEFIGSNSNHSNNKSSAAKQARKSIRRSKSSDECNTNPMTVPGSSATTRRRHSSHPMAPATIKRPTSKSPTPPSGGDGSTHSRRRTSSTANKQASQKPRTKRQ